MYLCHVSCVCIQGRCTCITCRVSVYRDDVLVSRVVYVFRYAFGTNGTADFNIRDFARNYHTTASAKAKYARYVDWRLLPAETYTPAQKYRANRFRCGSARLWSRVERVFTNPYFSPLLTSTTRGLPRAYVMVMDHDVLRDEGIMFARRLGAGGVKVRLAQCPGTHGLFNLMGMKYAQRELGSIAKYITDYV